MSSCQVDGSRISTFAEASAIIRESPGEPLSIVVERDGVAADDHAHADGDRAAGDRCARAARPRRERRRRRPQEVGFAGIRQEVEYLRQPIWAGPQAAFENVGAVAGIIWQLPVKVCETARHARHRRGARPERTAERRRRRHPLRRGRRRGGARSSTGVAGFLGLLASLNIALFVFNLIPLLPLDGGHIAVALWDGIKRAWAKIFHRPPPKPVDATKLVPVTFVVVIALDRDGRGADPGRHLQPGLALLTRISRRMSISALSVRCRDETVPLTKGPPP